MGVKLVDALRANHKPVRKSKRVLKARTTNQDVERAKDTKSQGISDAEFDLIKIDNESVSDYIARCKKEKRGTGGRLTPTFWRDLNFVLASRVLRIR